MRNLIVLTLALGLAACGQRAALEPLPGRTLPPAAYGHEVRPTANELLEPPPLAVPERSVELRRRSEERADNPFDLPPPESDTAIPVPPDAATGVADQPSFR